jgi:integrase
VKRAFRNLPDKSEGDYYILEKHDGPCLRVRRTVVQIGVRYRSRFHISSNLRPDMTLEEVEEAREEARRLLRHLDEEESVPGLARGKSMILRELYQEYMLDFQENRSAFRSPLTYVCYELNWRLHILPVLGDLRLCDITSDVIRQFKRQLPERVLKARPWARSGGKPTANRSLQQLNTALEFAFRMEWITRNPASARLVPRFEENRAEEFLDHKGYAAVGEVLRGFEARLVRGDASPLSWGAIKALRVAIYTGARHRSELLWTQLHWCHLDCDVPRIGIPSAKGNRAKGGGRWVFLGPEAVRLLKAIPRPAGSEHLTVPGKLPGRPLVRLNGPWHVVLRTAGLPEMTVKVLRHGFSTHSVGIIAPEHRAQLLGHQGRPMTDTVYLHHHGPDLARAAALVEEHFRELLGDLRPESSPRVGSGRICARLAGPRWWRQR